MKAVVGKKGKITIPKALRERLGLRTGTELDFNEEDGKLIGRRLDRVDPLEKLVGILPAMDVDAELGKS